MGKAMNALRALFYIVVILGIVFFIADLYYTRSGWQVTLAQRPEITPVGTQLKVTLVLDVYNPSHSTVKAKLLWYSLYLDNNYVGEGLKPYLELRPGHNKVRLSLLIDTLHLPCAVVDALAKGRVTLEVKGYTIITLMLFGKIGYKDITVPINTKPTSIEIKTTPTLQKALKVAATLCKLAETGQAPSIPGIKIP